MIGTKIRFLEELRRSMELLGLRKRDFFQFRGLLALNQVTQQPEY